MKVPAEVVGAAKVAVVLAATLIVVWFAPLILYVTVMGKACGLVKVILGEVAF
jgi:hypothetical protein